MPFARYRKEKPSPKVKAYVHFEGESFYIYSNNTAEVVTSVYWVKSCFHITIVFVVIYKVTEISDLTNLL